jgi:ABC-2 type transport system permease protein
MTALENPRTTTATERRVRFRGVLRAEAGKTTSLRSLRISMAALPLLIAAGMLLRAWAYAQTAANGPVGVPPAFGWQDVLGIGVHAGELGAVVLAAILAGSEYTARAAVSTYLAVPHRLVVLAAKALVLVAATAVLAAIGLLVGAVVSAPFMAQAHLAQPWSATAGDAASGAVLLVIVAVLTLAVGTLTRSTAAGIAIVLAVLLVGGTVAGLLGAVTGVDLGPFVLTYAAPMLTALHDPAGPGALAGDAVVTALWLAVPAAAAGVALVRRDV